MKSDPCDRLAILFCFWLLVRVPGVQGTRHPDDTPVTQVSHHVADALLGAVSDANHAVNNPSLLTNVMEPDETEPAAMSDQDKEDEEEMIMPNTGVDLKSKRKRVLNRLLRRRRNGSAGRNKSSEKKKKRTMSLKPLKEMRRAITALRLRIPRKGPAIGRKRKKRRATLNQNKANEKENDMGIPKQDQKEDKPQQQSPPNKPRRIRNPFAAFRSKSNNKAHEKITGASVLSGSFRLLSSTAGFLATGVRVTGDTAAGVLGSSVKVAGTTVKTLGGGLTLASQILDNSSNNKEGKNGQREDTSSNQDQSLEKDTASTCPSTNKTSEVLTKKPAYTGTTTAAPNPQESKHSKRRFLKRTQTVAARTARLLGNVMDGVGETILIAGVAAESLASSTAGVAEETVRIVENLAGTLSIAITLRGEQRRRKRNPSHQQKASNKQFQHPFLSFGTYSSQAEGEEVEQQRSKKPLLQHRWELFELLAEDMATYHKHISAHVEGVPSMAGELAAALLLCHLLAVVVLYRRPSQRDESTRSSTGKETCKQDSRSFASKLDCIHSRKLRVSASQFLHSTSLLCLHCMFNLPFKLFCCTCRLLFRVVCSREMLLFLLYGLVWAYLSRQSQDKALLVQRHAEAVGFRNGLASISGSALPTETTLWLNKLVEKVWRVESSANLSHVYPIFVKRAFNKRASHVPHGGLEPFLSSAIGSGIVKGLDNAKKLRPTDVAYVSLHSLSLGQHPPMVRSVKLHEEEHRKGNRIEVFLEVDAFLEDFAMVLDVKMSSLSYALLPSTKIQIHDVNFRASIKAILYVSPRQPFVSRVELTMLKQPLCDLRVTPVSADSFLHGVDLGSIPFLNDWIQEAIRSGLSNYVAPRYISIGVEDLLHIRSTKSDLKAASGPSLENLRRKTRFSVSDPRTSIPEAIAVTSIADKLESRQSSCQPMTVATTAHARSRRNDHKDEKSFLRPTTELSRMAQERHALKHDTTIRPVTELSRRGMDRWLDAKVKMKPRAEVEEEDLVN